MPAAMNIQLPRLPQALAIHQEAHPLVPIRREPLPQILGRVISLKAMCAKWWLEKAQQCLRRGISKHKLFALQKYLTDLPRELRSYIVHNGLKAGGLHLAHGSKEIPAVNRSLVFLSSDIVVESTLYITLPQSSPEGMDCPQDVEFLMRSGEGVLQMVITLPVHFCEAAKRLLSDICRTCRRLTQITVHEACDDAVATITRYCRNLQKLDVAGSEAVTDEGIARAIVNLRWADTKGTSIKYFDVDHTSVTEDGLMQLITRLPSITSFGSTDIVEALEGVALMSAQGSFTTDIEEANLKCATVNRIKTLRKFCRNIKSLKIIFQEHPGATLNDLRLLPNLLHIDVTVREPFLLSPAHLHDLAWAFGPRLQTLKVSGDVFWEADLAAVAAQCPFLRTLSLPAITLPHKESLIVLQAKGTATLSLLTELELDCMKGVGPKAWAKDFNLVRRGLVAALKRCLFLRRLVLRPTCLVDSDCIDILSENRLEKLEVLEMYNSTLSLSGAMLIVDTCINLHVMKGLRTWRGITLHDLVMLRKFSRGHRRAADLKIIP